MITESRWGVECELMANVFPEFTPYSRRGVIGFRGKLQGPRTGQLYEVVIQATIVTYPEEQPAVYIDPHPEPHHWLQDGKGGQKLCVQRTWKPAKSTFANTLLVTVRYIRDFD